VTSDGAAAPEISPELVHRLVARQFPRWAGLPVRDVAVNGWDNRTFRLGDDLLVRLPSAATYAAQVEKEQRWLPRLAPLLPLPIPVPLAQGGPEAGYPWNWSVYRWLPGEVASPTRIADPVTFAQALAGFLDRLHRLDLPGPPPGAHNFHRGGPMSTYDAGTRAAIVSLGSSIDGATARAVWEAALAAPWRGRPGWVHGDVAANNLLVEGGKLRAVIDFGSSAVGDPACDLTIAWTLLDGVGGEAFRAAVIADEAMWARARGWALWKALITLEGAAADDEAADDPAVDNPAVDEPAAGDPAAVQARVTLERVLADRPR
jgi:aminoglycoside phosphotransferase (APT) family kinase protein